MKLAIRCYAVVLLLYSGWRSYDFIKNQLPEGEISMWLSILFLFATEAGLFIWHEASINHSTTYTQHTTAVILTWVDFAASLSAGTADMILRQTLSLEGYQVPPLMASGLIFGISLIVAANVAGALVFLANDRFPQPPGGVNDDLVAFAVNRINGEHDACRIGKNQLLHDNRQRHTFWRDVLTSAVANGEGSPQRSPAFLISIEHLVCAGDVEIGFLLTGEGGLWQVFGGG